MTRQGDWMNAIRLFGVIFLVSISSNLDAMEQDWKALVQEGVCIQMPNAVDLTRRFKAGELADLVSPKTTIIEQLASSESSAEVMRMRFASCLADNKIARADQIKFLRAFKAIVCDIHNETLMIARIEAERAARVKTRLEAERGPAAVAAAAMQLLVRK